MGERHTDMGCTTLWSNDGCPDRALCVNFEGQLSCVCELSESMLVLGQDGKCHVSDSTIIMFCVTMAIMVVSFVVSFQTLRFIIKTHSMACDLVSLSLLFIFLSAVGYAGILFFTALVTVIVDQNMYYFLNNYVLVAVTFAATSALVIALLSLITTLLTLSAAYIRSTWSDQSPQAQRRRFLRAVASAVAYAVCALLLRKYVSEVAGACATTAWCFVGWFICWRGYVAFKEGTVRPNASSVGPLVLSAYHDTIRDSFMIALFLGVGAAGNLVTFYVGTEKNSYFLLGPLRALSLTVMRIAALLVIMMSMNIIFRLQRLQEMMSDQEKPEPINAFLIRSGSRESFSPSSVERTYRPARDLSPNVVRLEIDSIPIPESALATPVIENGSDLLETSIS